MERSEFVSLARLSGFTATHKSRNLQNQEAAFCMRDES
jgi:hypothetical protein